jgi:uncharacterized protein involved in propanediol utilization
MPHRPCTGTGWAPGTFGELLQGVLPAASRHFLVTLPITAGSWATFHHRPDSPVIRAEPLGKHKSCRLARMTLEFLGRRGGGELLLRSELPEGKGMASSSADLVATARAVAAACGETLGPRAIESLLKRLEPSDGVMYDEIVAFHHRDVSLHSRLGHFSPLAIVGYDEGGQVDTIRYNRRAPSVGTQEKRVYQRLLHQITEAVAGGDLPGVGQVATASAVMNARSRRRMAIEPVLRACADVGGYGVVAAHSGTMLGVLLRGDDPELTGKAEQVRVACDPLGGRLTIHRYQPAAMADSEEVRQ